MASIPPTVVALKTPRETIITSIRTARFHGLNPTAARMWESMAQGRSLHQAALGLAREYGVAPAIIERDLIALAASLESRQLPPAHRFDRGQETLRPPR